MREEEILGVINSYTFRRQPEQAHAGVRATIGHLRSGERLDDGDRDHGKADYLR